MLTKATVINWLLTVVIGSLIFAVPNSDNGQDYLEFGLLAMAISSVFGGSTLIVMLVGINVWIKRQEGLARRLKRVHLLHLVCALVTLLMIYFLADGNKGLGMVAVVAAFYCPPAALFWLISSRRLLKSEKVMTGKPGHLKPIGSHNLL